MKISKTLPQFNGTKSLVVVTGRQDAEFFIAQDGMIEKKEEFKIQNPKYTDREGFFGLISNGKTLGTGSVYEPKKHKVVTDFLITFGKKLKEITEREKIQEVFLFTPKLLSQNIFDKVPTPLKNKITLVSCGNYNKMHPFELLEKIKDKLKPNKILPQDLDPKRRKLLDKVEKAGKVVSKKP